MSKSPSTECEETICKMFKGKKNDNGAKNDKTAPNCNNVYYYLDSTKTHPDGGWFTCRNGKAGFFSTTDPKPCRSKAGVPKKRQKPGEKFYGSNGILYNAFKDTFDRVGQMNNISKDQRKYVFQKKKNGKECSGSASVNPLDQIIYLVPREMLNDIRGITIDNLKNQENLEAGDLVGLIRRFTTNFLFKTIMPPEWTKKFLKNNWDLLSALSKITSHGNPFDPVKINFEQTYMKLNKGGGRTKRKRKKMRRKTRVKRKKTQKRKKAKRKYKKRRTKRRR